jgi:biotin carboxylase
MKKLLVLGGTSSSYDLVKTAKEMGVMTYVADEQPTGIAKEIADRALKISTSDIEGLARAVKEHGIHGVFCGPSEFNIQNCIKVSEAAGLPFYCTQRQWDACANKASFKKMCGAYGVPCVRDFAIEGDIITADLKHIEYPVVVKPVDGCSSKGIRVCHDDDELRGAYAHALRYSASGGALVEHYIQSEVGFSAYYIAVEGRIHLSLTGDKHIVDPENKLLITAAALFPSRRTADYMRTVDPRVREMFRGLGLKNGVLFMQALVEDGRIYFHDMGLRLSGGLMYKFTEALSGVNDMKMMIRCALGEPMCGREEERRIRPDFGGKCAGSLCIPLKCGTISEIRGLDEIMKIPGVHDFMQYYHVNDRMTPEKTGTLMQHFGRLKMIAEDARQVTDIIDRVNRTLVILDENGEDMIYRRFDASALRAEEEPEAV